MIDLIRFNKIFYIDIKKYVYSFIPRHYLVWTTKEYYLQHHNTIINLMIEKTLFDSYMRMIIRKDYDFIFETIMNSTLAIRSWKKKYNYGNAKYINYYNFVDYYAFNNNAQKIRSILFTNVYRKKYKKIYRSKEWIT